MRPRSVAAVLLVLVASFAVTPRAQRADADDSYAREHYTKHEYRIEMRDGTRLFTGVYVPKDRSKTYPIMLQRTPYSVGPYGVDQFRATLGPSEHFMRDGFIFVYQDVRGRYMSEGTWVEVRPHRPVKRTKADTDESTDTWDTIDWLVEHVAGNNGRVGTWGISYPGFYVSAGLVDAHPALKAASPQAPVTDYYLGDDAFHNGAFMLAANFGFYTGFVERKGGPAKPGPRVPFEWGTPDGYDYYLRMGPLVNAARAYPAPNPYWQINLDHTTYDEFWKARSIWRHVAGATPSVMTVGGWFDAEDLQGPLRMYRAIEPASAGRTNMLVMGPWTHGSWARGDGERVGNVRFGSKTSAWFREHVELPFFAQALKDRAPARPLPEALVFETGTNEWASYDTWPPRDAAPQTFFLGAAGSLTTTAPTAGGFDAYVSDPSRPVPYVGYVTMGMRFDYMTDDQRFAATRPDVLVYQGDVLERDLRVTGPIDVTLHVSTTGTDADFVVKLIDVYPGDFPTPAAAPGAEVPANAVRMGGYQQLVRGEPFRGKFRNGFEKPEPFMPGTPATITFTMPDVAHVFRAGHRVMVQVQSSWFPLTDRNPQTFGDIPTMPPSDFKAQTHRVYREPGRTSSITVRVRP